MCDWNLIKGIIKSSSIWFKWVSTAMPSAKRWPGCASWNGYYSKALKAGRPREYLPKRLCNPKPVRRMCDWNLIGCFWDFKEICWSKCLPKRWPTYAYGFCRQGWNQTWMSWKPVSDIDPEWVPKRWLKPIPNTTAKKASMLMKWVSTEEVAETKGIMTKCANIFQLKACPRLWSGMSIYQRGDWNL